jgi:hypothetical protein
MSWFLKVCAFKRNVWRYVAGLDAAAPSCLGQTSVFNSLECKISCSNSKVGLAQVESS